jgi:DNA (cytosine-5)-methyltransferase 1
VSDLVLSLFPGIGLLDRAFEEEGFTVVRGPDVLWGGDVRRFHPPPGVFAGVIGGPPCQPFSRLRHMFENQGRQSRHDNLIPEYERVVAEAQPEWFVMEEVPAAPEPGVAGYRVRSQILNNRWFGEDFGADQERVRRISFGTRDGHPLPLEVAALLSPVYEQAVVGDARPVAVKMGGGGKLKTSLGRPRRSIARMCELQGLPPDFADEMPFTETAKRRVIGNGVPSHLGRAIARAVKRAMAQKVSAA